jgi:hypothetical protein
MIPAVNTEQPKARMAVDNSIIGCAVRHGMQDIKNKIGAARLSIRFLHPRPVPLSVPPDQ